MNKEENFHQKLRDLIPKIKETRAQALQAELNLKKVFWIEICKAKEAGEKSYNHQKSRSEATEEYAEAALGVVVLKARLDGLHTEKAAVDMQFETWRTRMANLRAERFRYGA